MDALAILRVGEPDGGRSRVAAWSVIAHICPQPGSLGFAITGSDTGVGLSSACNLVATTSRCRMASTSGRKRRWRPQPSLPAVRDPGPRPRVHRARSGGSAASGQRTSPPGHVQANRGRQYHAELMASIPGIGRTTVAVMLGYVGDMRRCNSAKALAAHLGVGPRQRTSGTSVRGRTSMSRTGNRSTRSALYMPAVVASRHNPLLKAFAERLHANGLFRTPNQL